MPVEKSSLDANVEPVVERLMREVKRMDGVGDVLSDMLKLQLTNEAERRASNDLKTSLQDSDQFRIMEAQSELTAAKLLSLQTRMTIEERRIDTGYRATHDSIREMLGDYSLNPHVLKEIISKNNQNETGF